ncbi:hypothetical protein [Anthocerotibacter panamensis]|uniref:hypothetical protein n=1 Tax=Anthocerotibacter panamensis TaxID=2857077 RepID=UPI001C4049CE|nr:hypothetical protein [Anthocerotibacter panamensis]
MNRTPTLLISSFFALLCLIVALPAMALPSPSQATVQVYRELPFLPKGVIGADAAAQNLIRRLVTYHTFVKGRSPYSRFDWKLTLADYLGYNESLRPDEYPGREELPSNPLQSDKKLINDLTRSQRDALIAALLQVYRDDPTGPSG